MQKRRTSVVRSQSSPTLSDFAKFQPDIPVGVWDIELIYIQLRRLVKDQRSIHIFSVVLTLIVLLVAYFAVHPNARVDSLVTFQKPFTSWTIDDVGTWLDEEGFSAYKDSFAKKRVDGNLLLVLDEYDLEGDFSITSSFDRKRLILAIDGLRLHLAEKPHTFWQYRSAYRFETQMLSVASQNTPRGLLLYLYLSGSPYLQILFSLFDSRRFLLLGWTLVPRLFFGFMILQYLRVHPFLVSLVVHNFINSTVTGIINLARFDIREMLKNRVVSYCWLAIVALLFPITPWLVCDILFYTSMARDMLLPLGVFILWVYLRIRDTIQESSSFSSLFSPKGKVHKFKHS